MSDLPPHKLEELAAYVHGDGTPEERAAFEAHLRDCPECRADVERLQRLLPFAYAELRKPLDTSVDGMMRLMEAAEQELQTRRAEQRARRARRRPWILAGATVAAAVAVAAVFLLAHPVKSRNDVVAAPRRDADGG